MTRRVERNPRPIARSATLALSLLWCLPFAGCASTPAAPAAAPPDFERLRAVQDRRAAMFRILESTGTIELRSLVEGGESFDSCAMDLWRQGDEFALRLRKFGERFLWIGSDGRDWWVFELAGEPTRLVVMPLDRGLPTDLPLEESLLGPRKLLEIAGLMPFGDRLRVDGPELAEDGLLRLETRGSGEGGWHRLRWTIEPRRMLPVAVEALDDQGRCVVRSSLREYEPIAARDQPVGDWPQFPGKVLIRDATGETDVRIYFNRPNARGGRIKPALFDLERLIETFKPERVEHRLDRVPSTPPTPPKEPASP